MNQMKISLLLETKSQLPTVLLQFTLVLIWAKNFNSKIIVCMLANETEVDFRLNKNDKKNKNWKPAVSRDCSELVQVLRFEPGTFRSSV